MNPPQRNNPPLDQNMRIGYLLESLGKFHADYMKIRRYFSMKKSVLVFLSFLLIHLCISSPLFATKRGISIQSKQGQDIYLYKDYHALVVGVGDYDYWPDLRGAVKDAKEVSKFLESKGFKTTLILNPTYRELKKALNRLVYGPGKVKDRAILFYFSGHGATETLATGEKMGYLVPKDAPIPVQNQMDFTDKAISMNTIESYALRIKSKHVLMLFDSCFSGSVFSSLKGVPTDISEKSNRPVRQFITAGNENEQVPDDSVFEICFLQGIGGEADLNKDGYVTGSELGLYLDSSVVNYTRGSQHPQYGKIHHPKLDKGDFVFQVASSGMLPSSPTKPTGLKSEERRRFEEEQARLERERRELEQLRAELERKQRESEKRVEVASVPSRPSYSRPSPPTSNITGRDGVYVAYANGIVRDTKTGLEWKAGPDRDTTWNEAQSWVQSLGGDWRMPTIDELKSLYKNRNGDQNMTPLLKTTGWWVWSGETQGSFTAWSFYFDGGHKSWFYYKSSGLKRAFAVRSQSGG